MQNVINYLAEVLLDELVLDGGLEALLGGLQLAGNLVQNSK